MITPGSWKTAALAAYALLALSLALFTLYGVVISWHIGPFRDMWIAMDFIRRWNDGSAGLAELFSLHGGAHRLAVPRLFFLLEYRVFHGSNLFLMATSFCVQASVVGLVWLLVRGETHLQSAQRYFVVSMALLLMFNATLLENFLYTFDMQWFLTAAAAIWALVYWNRAFDSLQPGNAVRVHVAIALAATLVSMFSSFSGLCLWLVLPLLAITYRTGRTVIVVTTTLVLLVTALYLSGPFATGGDWGTPQELTPGVVQGLLWDLLWRFVTWIGLYFGSPLSRWNTAAGFIVSYTSLLFLLWQWWKLLRDGKGASTPFQRAMLSIALWAAVVGVATGLGRMYFVHTAPEDRYQSIVLVYWLGLFGYMYSRAVPAARVFILLWTCVVIPVASFQDMRAQVSFFDRVKDTNLAIATGQWDFDDIKDTLILGDKWKKTSRPAMHGDYLRTHQWGVFAEADVQQLGQHLDEQAISADRCEGQVDLVHESAAPYRGYRIVGQGLDVQREVLLTSYLAIDASGTVVGLGRLQRPKNFLLPIALQPQEQAHWLLYTQDLAGPGTLRVLARLPEGGYCVMASAKLPTPAG